MAVIKVHGKQVLVEAHRVGRTQLMLAQAARASARGPVVVVGVDGRHADELRARIDGLGMDGVTVATLGDHRRLRGGSARIFIDHAVLELRDVRPIAVGAMVAIAKAKASELGFSIFRRESAPEPMRLTPAVIIAVFGFAVLVGVLVSLAAGLQ